MPGIYVRTLSQFDWLEQEKESLLTVPGSYWLCHKKNIYKFIFRYHRTVKNTMQFSYGRELLKIIRRIIKCHPTQGQQFGTQHLLVTYNCTSWTRQDKMFAIMKFQQRTNAAAFSHAFVLTIRTLSSTENSLFDLKYPIVKEADAGTTFKDLNASLDAEEKMINTAISTTDKVPSSNAKCQIKKIDQISKYNAFEDVLDQALKTTIDSFQDDIRDSAIFRENLDERIGSGATIAEMHLVDKHNTECHSNIQESKSINCITERCEKNIEQCSTECVQEQSLRAKKIDEIEIEKAHGIEKEKETDLVEIQKQNQHVRDIQKYKISSSLKPSLTEITKGSDELDGLDDKEMTKGENIVDSSNVLTYQSFIEKETEGAKPNLIMDQPVQKDLQTEIKDINKDINKDCVQKVIKGNNKSVHTKQREICNEMANLEVQENDRQHTKTTMNIDDKQSEDNVHSSKSHKIRKQKSRESERKTIPDKVLRSSNITDLVMEGLMFTIRQDQDSVAVIEQKTKLEVDEVLENSEKVETKAGEKCLLNSSLLRLENLVTMIDSPRNRDKGHKNQQAISNGANLSSFNAFPSDAVHNVNTNYVDIGMDKSSVSNYDRHNAMNHLNLYQPQWQHQCVPFNIKNNSDSCSAGISTEERDQLMEWQDDDNGQDKNYKNNTEMRKQEDDIIPEISSFKKINAELRDTNSLIRNVEEIDKRDKLTDGHNSALYSSLNPNGMSTKTTSVISKESNLINLFQQEANVPRIVSDKAITTKQMPPALQKALRHTCRARRFSSTIGSGMLQQDERKMQHMALAGDTISKADVLSEDKYTDPNVANNSLSIKLAIDSERLKRDNEKSRVTIDKDVPETSRDTRVKNSMRKNETHRTLRRSSSSKHGSPRKLQDITEEFYYDLLHVHNKDNAIRQRCLRQKQRSLNNLDDIKSGGKVRIEMLKFIQDITEGARVVVRRLNIDNKPN
ncbi:uncharacterized protein LOC143907424 [Temnothorax americanus]|uniref:uncharacterized protein LOC143907424 n=1 Tax=Temnothorax americanus TaxID=1964332 RepID=UPI004068FBB4